MSVAVRVIPCLDVDAGRVVKGVNFVNLRDAGDPVELGAAYDSAGADAGLAASIFHFGEISIGEVKQALSQAGHPVR